LAAGRSGCDGRPRVISRHAGSGSQAMALNAGRPTAPALHVQPLT
jgi:hypothetical protein